VKKFSFAVIADIQLGRMQSAINWWDGIWHSIMRIPLEEAVIGPEIERRLTKAVDWINSNSEIDFAVIPGDITESATPFQFRRAEEILKHLLKPCVIVLGNHDVWEYQRDNERKILWDARFPVSREKFVNYFKEEFTKLPQFFTNWEDQKGELLNFSFIYNNTKFIIVDNVNRQHSPLGLPGAAGWSKLYPASIFWLKKQLSESKGKKVIVFSHAPIKENVLSDSRQVVSIAGHTHKRSKQQKGNVVTITTNALRHEPLVLIVTVSDDGITTEYKRI